MVLISQKCSSSLDQEPGGPMCVQYQYRVLQSSMNELLKLNNGTTVTEIISNIKLKDTQISELFSLNQNQIKLIQENDTSTSAATNNPVPG